MVSQQALSRVSFEPVVLCPPKELTFKTPLLELYLLEGCQSCGLSIGKEPYIVHNDKNSPEAGLRTLEHTAFLRLRGQHWPT